MAISDTHKFSVPSSGGVNAYNSGLACILYSFATTSPANRTFLVAPRLRSSCLVPFPFHASTSRTVWVLSCRSCPISLANASIAGSLSHLNVTALCLNRSMHLAAVFAIQKNSVPCLGPNIVHVNLSPLTDDQHKGHFRETRCPSTRVGPFQIVLSIRSPVQCVMRSPLVPSRRTCTMICTVDVWSCAFGAP